jgi:hypothetical protein
MLTFFGSDLNNNKSQKMPEKEVQRNPFVYLDIKIGREDGKQVEKLIDKFVSEA